MKLTLECERRKAKSVVPFANMSHEKKKGVTYYNHLERLTGLKKT